MSSSRPEPVLDAAKTAGLVSSAVEAVGALLVLGGLVSAGEVASWAVAAGGAVVAVGAVISYVLPVITATGARGQVTPLADPKTVDGAPLTPAAQPPDELAARLRVLIDQLDEGATPVEGQARVAAGQG